MIVPDSIHSVDQLDELLSQPTPGVVETLSRLDGDLLILGVGGKMGPTLARMAEKLTGKLGTGKLGESASQTTKSEESQSCGEISIPAAAFSCPSFSCHFLRQPVYFRGATLAS